MPRIFAILRVTDGRKNRHISEFDSQLRHCLSAPSVPLNRIAVGTKRRAHLSNGDRHDREAHRLWRLGVLPSAMAARSGYPKSEKRSMIGLVVSAGGYEEYWKQERVA